MKKIKISTIVMYIILIFFAFIMLAPFVWMLLTAFKTTAETMQVDPFVLVPVKGKPFEEALQLTNKAVVEALGGLPPVKIHCSVLAEEAIKAAISDYLVKQGLDPELFGIKPGACDHDCESCSHV